MNKKNDVVVITGGSAGLGRAIAHEFAKHGASIALLARDEERLNDTIKEIEELGGKAIAIPTDVANAEQVERAAQITEEQLGPIDIWVNNAMTSVFAPFKDMTPEEFQRVNDVTYMGVVFGTMAAIKRMTARNKGTIVQVGSALAYRSIPLQSAYCGAKHAIAGFTDSIRSELIHDKSNIHITMVQMPALNTPQFEWVLNKLDKKAQPVPPIFQPEVGAKAVYWSAYNRKRELYVGLPAWKSIIGNKFIPGLLDHYLAKKGYEGQLTEEPNNHDTPNGLWEPVKGKKFTAHG
ncbi:MAG: SDR family NAD(P)-dependent oxidoreductase, partial [Pedobacter sp.]